jgi:hypothetical protein
MKYTERNPHLEDPADTQRSNGWMKRFVRLPQKFAHRMAHWVGCNHGRVETWHSEDGCLMVGFRCSCGELSNVSEAIPHADIMEALQKAKLEILGDES